MKTTKLLFCSMLSCVLLCGACSSSSSVARKEQAARTQQGVKQAVNSNSYKIEVNQMIPTGAPSRMLTTLYSLEIKNDSVFSYLPYFGRAYSAPYGGGNSMSFNAPVEDYKVKYGRKDKIEIEFDATNMNDRLTYRITIFPNASASINVNSNNRQPVSYQGNLVLP